MTNQSPFGGRMGRQYPTLPKGETVATFETYPEAQAAVDTLAKAEFPVKELAIVGTDLTTVERITGKLTWGRAGGAGAISGAWFGTFLGLLFFIFSPTGTSVGILISAILLGAGFGMIFGLVSYSVNRRRRDFTSTMQVLATRYAIIAEPAHVTRARQVLGTTDAPAPPVASPSAPPVDTPAPHADSEAAAGDAESATSDAATGEAVDDEPRGLTYGEAQDAARRAARERRNAGD
ncbi:general stress protein [Agromyces neolithicus]|uniref:General stress protein 17M-like domain-containing protein n=1 Tax=Agromyces neolithicus TaxID=269420 RepID=A0ABN2MBX3_9MICO